MGAWSTAARLARETPPERNRYVDLLRAVSILCVIFGHWTAAAPYVDAEGRLANTHMLAASPWTRWLTWCIQVMPVFFIVGGYANAVSWRSTLAKGGGYAGWLEARLRRLVAPVLAVVAGWVGLGVFAWAMDLPEVMLRVGSQMALIPIWFLAVYVLVAVCVPWTHALWQRMGLASFWLFAGLAVLGDLAFFRSALPGLGWLNYLFVWSAVHQLGYAWRDGHFDRPARALAWAAGGALALALLVRLGPYPVSMVGVPGEGLSNTTPPKLVLVALGCVQGGLLLALQAPARRLLARPWPWTATIVVNGMIMTVYLWHMTVFVLLVGLAHWQGDAGLHVEPGTTTWWLTQPLWWALGLLGLALCVPAFARFERPRPPRGGAPPHALRLALAAVLVCAGLALLALRGVAGDGPLGMNATTLALPFLGGLLLRRFGAAASPAPSPPAAH